MSIVTRVYKVLEKSDEFRYQYLSVWFTFVPLRSIMGTYRTNGNDTISFFKAISQKSDIIPFRSIMHELQLAITDIPVGILCWIAQYYYDDIEPLKKFRMIQLSGFYASPKIACIFMTSDQTFADLDRLVRYKKMREPGITTDSFNMYTFEIDHTPDTADIVDTYSQILQHYRDQADIIKRVLNKPSATPTGPDTRVVSAYTTIHEYEEQHRIPHCNFLKLRFVTGKMYARIKDITTYRESTHGGNQTLSVSFECCNNAACHAKIRHAPSQVMNLMNEQLASILSLSIVDYCSRSRKVSSKTHQICETFYTCIHETLIRIGADIAFMITENADRKWF